MDNPNLAMEVQTRYILHWNYRGYEKLPEELLKYGSHVEEIYFKENGLKELPENLNTQLKHLSQLYLYGNRLHSLPNTIGNIQTLQVLDLSRNQLEELPDSIGQLVNLTTLDLSHNLLTCLPESIGTLSNLDFLIVIRNRLEKLPKSIQMLHRLRSLHLNGNQLIALPPEMAKCRSLEDIYLEGNLLSKLPSEMAQMPKLNHICVSNNQLNQLPILPFISMPRITFDDNPNIREIPAIFGCQQSFVTPSRMGLWSNRPTPAGHDDADGVTWTFAIKGCFLSDKNETPQPIRLPRKTPASLMETSLRSVYERCFQKQVTFGESTSFKRVSRKSTNYGKVILDSDTMMLPKVLKMLLMKGPKTFCCNPGCTGPLFLEGVKKESKAFVVFKEDQTGQDQCHQPIATFYFCGDWCSNNYLSYFLSK